MPQMEGLGHVGVYTKDLMKMRDFYTRVLGLEVADEDLEQRGMVFLSSNPDYEHHEFVLMKGRKSTEDTQVIQQISFKVPTIDDLRGYYHRLQAEDAKIDRIVSHGNAFGMYFFDPEGNRIELYYKTGFPVPQPHGDPIDLNASNEELLAIARAVIPAEAEDIQGVADREEQLRWDSGDFLAGVFSNPSEIEAALNELGAEGVSRDDIRIFQGESGREEFANIGGKGLAGLVRRGMADYVGNAKDLTGRHKEALERGHYVMIVPLPASTLRNQVHRILTSHGGCDVVARIGGAYTTYE